jgi:hypothetical protein
MPFLIRLVRSPYWVVRALGHIFRCQPFKNRGCIPDNVMIRNSHLPEKLLEGKRDAYIARYLVGIGVGSFSIMAVQS